MNEFLKNTASLTAAEITTNKIYLEGEEIGDAMLPKLVKRASLTPIVEDGIVKENIYYHFKFNCLLVYLSYLFI